MTLEPNFAPLPCERCIVLAASAGEANKSRRFWPMAERRGKKICACGRLDPMFTSAAILAAALLGRAVCPRQAANDNVYTVGNYPVDARAANAVAAKERALADGQQAAFRSLLKRLVPVTNHGPPEAARRAQGLGLPRGRLSALRAQLVDPLHRQPRLRLPRRQGALGPAAGRRTLPSRIRHARSS